MGIADLGQTGTAVRPAGGISSLGARPVSSGSKVFDVNTLEGLTQRAQQVGLGEEAIKLTQPEPKLSFLNRLGKGLSALNPAEAVATGMEKGFVKGALKYPKSIVTGLGSAITGKDYEPKRRHFSDVVKKLGVENAILKHGLGFAGDVLLDPSTYFGGAIVKGLLKGTKLATNVGLKGVGKVAPATETGLRMAGTGLQDAVGKAFVAGFKSSKGAMDDVLTFMSKKTRARMGIAASNLNRLGTGVLSKDQQTELALKLVLGKRAEFLAREAGKGADEIAELTQKVAQSADPLVKKALQEQLKRSQKFGAQLKLENPYETYFPFIKKDKLDKFLAETGSKGIRVGSEGYRKQFKNLLTNENIELDPAKAFFTSEAAQATDRMTRGFLNGFVKKYGKPLESFASADDAGKAGFKVLREKGMFGKELGYIGEHDARLLRDLISPEFQTVNMLAKATGFDAVTNLFKRSVTGLFLPFHVRNFTSGVIQNFETLGPAALNPKTMAAGQKIAYLMAKGGKPGEGIIKVAGKPEKFSKVYKAFADRFGSDTFYQNDFLGALDTGAKELRAAAPILGKESLKQTVKTIGLGQEGVPFRVGRAIGQFIEHQQKATAYLTALGQGKNIDDALRLAERAGFDYRALTAFESQILRRLVPFYSFTRKNVELQLKTLGESPQRVNQILRFFEEVPQAFGAKQPTAEEKKDLPRYIQNALGIKLSDTPEGLKQYISSFGTPVEAFSQMINDNPILFALSQTNPLIKAPIEIGIGKDSFRQKDLKDVYDAREYKNAPQIIKDLLDIKQGKKDILEKDKRGKLKKVGERDVYVADPKKLLIARSLFTSRGVTYLDQIFGGDLEGFVKWMKLTTGIKPQQVDVELGRTLKERDQKRALEDLLKKTGNIATFERAFIPKD